MLRFLTCTWVRGYKYTVELCQGCCALHRPLAPDNLILSSVLVYKKDHINVVLLSDATIVVQHPGWCSSRRVGRAPVEGGLRWEPLQLLFQSCLLHSGCLPALPKGFTYMASLINLTASFGVSLCTFPAVIMVKCLLTLVWCYFSPFSNEL